MKRYPVACTYLEHLKSTTEITPPELFIECHDECKDFHPFLYLNHIYFNKIMIEKEMVLKYASVVDKKTRELAFRYILSHYDNKDLKEDFFYDPDYKIRCIFVSYLDNKTLIRYTEDENTEVQLHALREISKRNFDDESMKIFIRVICRLITNIDVRVRIYAAKLISIYKNYDKNILIQLLTKKEEDVRTKEVVGAIVYGLEDESFEVRKNTAISLFTISSKDLIDKTFEYLVDTLNDEHKDVREIASNYLYELSETYSFFISQEYITQISCSLEEDNQLIRKNILGLFSNINLASFESFLFVVDLFIQRLDIDRMIDRIIKLTIKNLKLVEKSIDQVFRNICCLGSSNLLYDKKYVSQLLIILVCSIFDKRVKIRNVEHKKHLNFVIQRIQILKNGGTKDLNDFIRKTMVLLLTKINKTQDISLRKSIFKEFEAFFSYTDNKTEFHKSFCVIYKFLKMYYIHRSLNILKLNFLFRNFYITSEGLENKKYIISLFEKLTPCDVLLIENSVMVKNLVKIKSRKMIFFEICSHCKVDESVIVVESNKKERIELKYADNLRLKIRDDGVKDLKVYIIKMVENVEVVISNVTLVCIERK